MKKLIVISMVLTICSFGFAAEIDIPANSGVGDTGFTATDDGPDEAGAWNVDFDAGANYLEQWLYFDESVSGGYTFADLEGISMYAKDADTSDAYKPYVQIYTKPTGTDDAASWYHQIYTSDITATSNDSWYSWTAEGFFEGRMYSNTTIDKISLGDLSNNVNEEIKGIKFQLGDTNTNNFPFAGSVSEPTIQFSDMTNNYHLTPEPTTIAILGLGALGLIRRRRRA